MTCVEPKVNDAGWYNVNETAQALEVDRKRAISSVKLENAITGACTQGVKSNAIGERNIKVRQF